MTTPSSEFSKRQFHQIRGPLGITAPALACPLCTEDFRSEHRLWQHAIVQHNDQFDALGSAGEAEEKQTFINSSLERA